jgi:hypothetical protein
MMKLISSLFAITTGAILLFSCKKNGNFVTQLPVTLSTGLSNVKIVHASAYNTNYTVQLKVNDARVSNNITYSTPFPGGGLNTGGSNFPWYMNLTGGDNKITMSVPKAGTNVDSILLFNGNTYMQPDVYTTVYIYDTGANTQLAKKIENTTMPAYGTARFKFVNLIPNLPFADLYAGPNKVASNIAYSQFSPEFTLNMLDTVHWYIRPAGALPTSGAIAQYPTTTIPQTIPNQRIFTVYSRGYVGTIGNRLPAISLLFN